MSIIFHEDEWSWRSMTLYQFVEEKNYPKAWCAFFEREDVKSDLKTISENIVSKKPVYPDINRVFRAFTVPIEKIRVVILGMDPYHNAGSAVGLCFSVPKGAKVNPSLRNIFQELGCTGYKDGDLQHWADQGCFMLNTALTVLEGCPDSHTDIWYDFSRKVIKEISEGTGNVAWLLMGAKAIDFEQYIDTSRHSVFKTSHPSPFSAYRSSKVAPAFIGSGVFNSINLYLQKQSLPLIKWIKTNG
jgi:uracil-DNA glycosylase